MRLRHVGIVCHDIEKSLQFYCNYLGCEISRRMLEKGTFISTILGMAQAQIETIKLKLPQADAQIELLGFTQPQSVDGKTSLNRLGLTHFAVQVSDIDALYKTMHQDGIHFICAPQLSDDKRAKVCFCQDPNGVYIELVELL